MTTQNTTLILGAGLSGLTAARQLHAAGKRVLILDKGRGVGGRLATRRADDGVRFDHGAQYFTARDSRFIAAVDEWKTAGVAQVWTDDFSATASRNTGPQPKYPRYRGTEGMAGVAKFLAMGLDVRSGVKVVSMKQLETGWEVTSERGEKFRGEDLILTMPVPQSLTLLADSGMSLDATLKTRLERIRYAPCLALMVTLAGPSAIPTPGGLFVGPEPIAWMADNQQKGISSQISLTIHAGPEFSEHYFAAPEAEVSQLLLNAAKPHLGSAVVKSNLHRWRYSLPTVTDPERYALWTAPHGGQIYFAGDAFGGPRVEGAFLSGFSVAEAILQS
jgi:renalase